MDVEALRLRLRADLTEAMRTGDRVRTRVIRTLTAAFSNAEAVPGPHGSDPVPFGTADVPRATLVGERAAELLDSEIQERSEAAVDYDRHGQADAADTLRSEMAILRAYRAEFGGADRSGPARDGGV